jgi:hypothetical protein
VREHHPEEGMLVFFDGYSDEDAAWVQVGG